MNKFFILCSAGLLSLAGATPSSAVPYTGSLGLSIGGLATPVIIGGGSASGVTGAVTFSLASGDFTAVGVVLPITDPAASPLLGIQLTAANASGAFAGGAGIMPVLGVAHVCLFAPCTAPPPANVTVPLSVVGIGGTTTITGLVNVTVIGAPWTTGTAAVFGTITMMGGTTGGGAAGGGQVTLVTPVILWTNTVAGVFPVPSFATLTLNFVPEPGTLLLVGSGIAVLAALGRRRLG